VTNGYDAFNRGHGDLKFRQTQNARLARVRFKMLFGVCGIVITGASFRQVKRSTVADRRGGLLATPVAGDGSAVFRAPVSRSFMSYFTAN